MLAKIQIILLILISIFALFDQGFSETKKLLRMSAPSSDPSLLDPATYNNTTEAMITASIYSRLLEVDDKTGNFYGDLAKRFYWNGSMLVFELRENIFTSKKQLIKPIDFKKSFVRMFRYRKSKDLDIVGGLEKYLCTKNIDKCEGIKTYENKISFKFPFKSRAFLEYLTHTQYSVVPSEALKGLQVIDRSNTTGRYTVAEKTQDYVSLERNVHYRNHLINAADEIRIFKDFRIDKTGSWFSYDAIESGEIDFISPEDSFDPSAAERFKKNIKQSTIFVSDEIRSTVFVFTNKGMKIPKEDRATIVKIIDDAHAKSRNKKRAAKLKKSPEYIFKRPLDQLLIPGSFGSFQSKEYVAMHKFRAKINTKWPTKIKKFVIGLPDEGWVKMHKNRHGLHKTNPIEYKAIGHNIDVNGRKEDIKDVDLIVHAVSVPYRETYSAIAEILQSEYMHIRGEAAKNWLRTFNDEKDRSERTKMLRKLHFESVVTNPSVIPYFSRANRGIATNGWNIDHISPHTARTKLWLITKSASK